MQVKQIAIVAAIASSFAMPMTAKASDIATLNGWGALFAAAHSGEQAAAQGQAQGEIKVSLFQRQQPPAAQPAPETAPQPTPVAEPTPTNEPAPTAEAPAMEQPEAGDQTASTGDSAGESAEAGQDNADQATASASASANATIKLGGGQSAQMMDKVDSAYQTAGTVVEGVTGGVLGTVQNVADKTSGASLAADMSSTGSMDVAGLATATMAGNMSATASMMNAGQLGAITAMTSSLIQNVIAARPASLSGLLR
ncbi:hypothetical protein [uncultured Limnobacter sp.]|jgi:outer membrane biosynthesis protein TonB|uniref:hypothetical protein n=1 Tax=uncultured Limnobacter sp. TaxID=199681 RepID=UPI0030FBF740